MKITKEAKIGITAFVVLIMLYWGINFLKGLSILESRTVYYLEINDATGMQVSTALMVRGIKAGSITDIEMVSLSSKINVEIVVNSGYIIPNDSYIKLEEGAIMSAPILKLELGTSTANFESGDTIPFRFAPTMMQSINILFGKMFTVLDQVDTLAQGANKLLSDSTINNIGEIIKNINAASVDVSSMFDSQKARFDKIMSNVESLTTTFNEASPELKEALVNFNSVSSSLNGSMPQIMNDINDIIGKIQSTDGTVGKLLNNEQLYDNLEKSIESIYVLIEDMKLNPKKYINITVFEKLSPRQKEDNRLEKQKIKEERKAEKARK